LNTRRYFPILLTVWVVMIVCSFQLNLYILHKNSENHVKTGSEAFFRLLVATDEWNHNHGLVYVPVSKTMQPSPYITHKRRDVVTNFGDSLTLINPAIMMRQLSDVAEMSKITGFRITGLDPICPNSKPNEWELEALKTLKNENDRFFVKRKMGDSVIFMYMAPLMVKQSCLSCHSSQNRKPGDVMGGISINTLYRGDYLMQTSASLQRLIIIYFLILLIGFFLLMHIGVLNKRNQISIETKHRELYDLNAAKDKFISVIAHDLKTPAANIESLSAMLRDNFDHYSKQEQRDCIDMLVDSTKTHNDLLNTLLDLSRLRLGNILYNPERVEIRKLTNEVLEQTKLQAQQKHISQTNQVDECNVKVDKNMIAAVIRNLVVNGIKFTHSGGKIIVGSKRTETEIVVSVTDTGIGIVESKRELIFGVNSNKSTTGTANETGTGLGLLLCKEYVERNGGHIWLESEVGKGTTFFFTLPAV